LGKKAAERVGICLLRKSGGLKQLGAPVRWFGVVGGGEATAAPEISPFLIIFLYFLGEFAKF
jgi:hypothetical protein